MHIHHFVLAVVVLTHSTAPPVWTGEKLPLKVLYAGNPGSARELDFTAFLAQEFVSVGKVSLLTFTPRDADGYDVVIFDWAPLHDPKTRRLAVPKVNITHDYDRATLMIGGIGGYVGRTLGLKLDWL